MPKPFTAMDRIDETFLNRMVLGDWFETCGAKGTNADRDIWVMNGAVNVPANSTVVVDNSQDWRDRMCLHGLVMDFNGSAYLPGGGSDDQWDGSNNMQDSSGQLTELSFWYGGSGGTNYGSQAIDIGGETTLYVDSSTGELKATNSHVSQIEDLYLYLLFTGLHDKRMTAPTQPTVEVIDKPFTTAKKRGSAWVFNRAILGDYVSAYSPGASANQDYWIMSGFFAVGASSTIMIDDLIDYRDRMLLHGHVIEVVNSYYVPGNAKDDQWDGSDTLQDASGNMVELTLWYTGSGGASYQSCPVDSGSNAVLEVDNVGGDAGRLTLVNSGGSNVLSYMFLLFSGDHDKR